MSALISRAQHAASSVGNQIQITSNRILPPDQRQQKINELRDFANRNPKLAGFLAAQAVLTGTPLLVFLVFAFSTLLISLLTCALLGILVALTVSFTIIGFALLFLIPTLLLASIAACFVFGWTVVGYLVLRRFYDGERVRKEEASRGKINGHSIEMGRLTGGRVAFGWGNDGAEDARGNGKVGTTPAVSREAAGKDAQSGDGAESKENGKSINGEDGWDEKWRNGVENNAPIHATNDDLGVEDFEDVQPKEEGIHS